MSDLGDHQTITPTVPGSHATLFEHFFTSPYPAFIHSMKVMK